MNSLNMMIDQMYKIMKELNHDQLVKISNDMSKCIIDILNDSNIDRESKIKIEHLLHNRNIHDSLLIKLIDEYKNEKSPQ